MKKLLSLIFILLLSLSFVGCTGILPNENSGNNTSTDEFDTNRVTLASAYSKAQSLGFEGTLEEFVELISGKDGVNGKDGTDGKDGVDGIGITTVLIDNNGDLLVVLTNRNTINCGKVKGADGKDGVDGANGVDGTNGKDGINGTNGKDGLTPTFKIENGELKVSYDNGATWSSLGYIQGADGENGTNGVDGTNGKDGVTPTIEISTDGYWVINGVKTEYKAVADGSGSDTHPHSFSEWIRYTYDANTPCDTWLYYRICAACNDIEWKNGGYENHTITTVTVAPTCIAQGYDENTCSVCGFNEKTNYTAIAGHTYEETYSYSDSFHWLDCKYCDATTSFGEHSIDESGYCTVCDQPLAPTEGIVYDLSADGTYAEVVGYTGTATKIVIADTYNGVPVNTIYNEAFKENKSITSVVIPDSVVIIGDYAFHGCSSLTSVTIGNSVTSIGAYAFKRCSSLTSVTIGNSVTSIGASAFYYCSSLTSITIPDSVTSIGDSAFEDCSKLTSVTIGNSVTSIGGSAFKSCSRLKSVIIPDSVTYIGSSAFYGCHSSLYTEYEFGKYVGDENNPYAVLIEVTNNNLSTYTINENTKHIASSVFPNCARLTSITIPNSVTSIGAYAFHGCSSLTSVTIGNSVTNIGTAAFSGCSSLTSVTIGNSVTSIGYSAFEGCSSLTSVTIPKGVTYIGPRAFYSTTSLEEIYFNATSMDDLTEDNRVFCNAGINGNGIKVIIGKDVTKIPAYLFYPSLPTVSYYGDTPKIVSVEFEEGSVCESIGKYAFYHCTSLTSIKYRGTEEEWQSISKGAYWNNSTGNYTIIYNYTEE